MHVPNRFQGEDKAKPETPDRKLITRYVLLTVAVKFAFPVVSCHGAIATTTVNKEIACQATKAWAEAALNKFKT